MPRVDGFDCSYWQGAIDWGAVRAATPAFVAIRCWHTNLDSRFARNRAGAAFARWRPLYHYPAHGEDASRFIAAIGELADGEAAMLDAEAPGITVDDCARWCDQVEARWQRPALVYTSDWVSGGVISASSRIFNGARGRFFSAFTDLASAQRRAAPFGWDVWQWTDTGSFSGIAAAVDLDQVDRPESLDRACNVVDPLAIATAVWA